MHPSAPCLQVPILDLPEPLIASLPISMARLAQAPTVPRLAQCPTDGSTGRVEVLCTYESRRNTTLAVGCNGGGGEETAVRYACPVLPRCGVWNSSEEKWGLGGVTPLPMREGSRTTLTCRSSRLGTFSAIVDPAGSAFTTLVLSGNRERRKKGRSYGLVVAGAPTGLAHHRA